MFTFLKVFLYLTGAAIWLTWGWLQWMGQQPKGTPLKMYWQGPQRFTNISSVLISLLLMGAYLTGIVTTIVRAVAPAEMSAKIPPLYLEWGFAPIAGLLLTAAAQSLMKRLSTRLDTKGGGE